MIRRTNPSQFELLLEYMEKNGDLSKPDVGVRGRFTNTVHWSMLTDILNGVATGDTKTPEKWRKVWSDFKNNTKKKAIRIYRASQDGGLATNVRLSHLEKRVLNLIDFNPARARLGTANPATEDTTQGSTSTTVVPVFYVQPDDENFSKFSRKILELSCGYTRVTSTLGMAG